MAVVRTPDEFEAQLARFLYERSEEARAVRVGEKETSEQAAIVARYEDLFSREQHDALRADEEAARGEDRERLFRLREACAGGIVVRELADESDKLENAILAARVEFRGESLPLRSAQAQLAVLDDYDARRELGELAGDASARLQLRAATRSCSAPRRSMPSCPATPTRSTGAPTARRSISRALSRTLSPRRPPGRSRAGSRCATAGSTWFSARSARPSPTPTTWPTCGGCRLSPSCTRGTARCRSAWTRSRASASTWRRTTASASISTTGRRRTRARA